MEIRLDGRTALITGGSKGLGLAMAQKFASSGANIAIVARGALALAAAERSVGAVAVNDLQRGGQHRLTGDLAPAVAGVAGVGGGHGGSTFPPAGLSGRHR